MILTTITALAYPIGIQYKRGGVWLLLAPLALLVWAVDVLANYTEMAMVFGWPQSGDHTITARIRRLSGDPFESRRALAHMLQIYLDACEPDGKH